MQTSNVLLRKIKTLTVHSSINDLCSDLGNITIKDCCGVQQKKYNEMV